MGKGDKKSKRGKINNGSYGKRRPRKSSKSLVTSEDKSKK
ncbi:30S ribosomal protein THX [Chryseobacterium daeguense]|nr:30S ribosomal protein THX [Chryseobacterium daeguense]